MATVLPSLFRGPHGYFVTTDPDPTKSKGQQAVTEFHSITCGHNGELVLVKAMCPPNEIPYALCWGCRRNICLKCDAERAKTMRCDVIENKLERWEASDRLMRDLRK